MTGTLGFGFLYTVLRMLIGDDVLVIKETPCYHPLRPLDVETMRGLPGVRRPNADALGPVKRRPDCPLRTR